MPRSTKGTTITQPAGRPAEAQVQETGQRRYAIDFDLMAEAGRSPSYVVYLRLCGRCPACSKQGKDNPAYTRTPKDLMGQIASSCAQEPAYLLPGTPITEAVFRLMLASNNRPMTVAEVQGGLTQAWASVIYLKNLNEDVIRRMLEQPNEYFIRPRDEGA
jgi:hypothetical protein